MQLSTYSLLAIAYIIVWVAIFLYVARLQIEQRRLSRELENLKSKFPTVNMEFTQNENLDLGDRNLLPQQRS